MMAIFWKTYYAYMQKFFLLTFSDTIIKFLIDFSLLDTSNKK